MKLLSPRSLKFLRQVDLCQTSVLKYSSTATTVFKSPFKPVVLPNCSVPNLIWSRVEKWPEKTAVECGQTGKKYSYAELKKLSQTMACSLLRIGFRPGDVATLLLPNMPEHVVCILGLSEAGMTVTGVNSQYSADEVLHQVKDSNSKLLIFHPDFMQVALEVAARYSLQLICVDDFDGHVRPLAKGIRPLSSLLQGDHATLDSLRGGDLDLGRTSYLPYSSGTTGLPKGVCLSHSNITCNLAQLEAPELSLIESSTNDHQDTVPVVLPMFHIYGFSIVMLQSLTKGAKVVTIPKFEPKGFIDVLDRNKDIVLYAVPPMVLFMSSHPSVKPEHLRNIRTTITGAAPCSSEDLDKYTAKRNHHVIQAYGMTESSGVLTIPHRGVQNRSSIGAPMPNVDVKVVDVDSGQPLPRGETGELCFRGPNVMLGYHKNPKATAETVLNGWLHTGDIGHVDKDHYCYIVDRKKELIKVKGFQVAPAELEAVLRQHPDLDDVGISAEPCPRSGETPVAFVVPKNPKSPPSETSIKEFIAARVASFKQIGRVVYLDAVPKSPSGKILRRKLKELL